MIIKNELRYSMSLWS